MSINDWKKLKRVLQFIYGTLDDSRILSIRNFAVISVYVTASNASHVDARGHSPGCIVMGDDGVHTGSNTQTHNSKSSTETEFIGTSEYFPYALWLIHIVREQDYEAKSKRILQNNENTIKLLKNGGTSAGQQSRHINIAQGYKHRMSINDWKNLTRVLQFIYGRSLTLTRMK